MAAPTVPYVLPTIEVRGTPRELGRGQGEALRELVRAFVAERLRAARAYLWERGSRDIDGFLALGERCLAVLKDWDRDGHDEHLGIAEGAGIDPAELYTTTQMTDIRDVLILGATARPHAAAADAGEDPAARGPRGAADAPVHPADAPCHPADAPVHPADAEGCTTALIPASHSATRQVIAGQTWDLNPGDLDAVVAVHRRPIDGPATWTVTCAGSPTLCGMNEDGLACGTTNIKTVGSRVGVGYLSVLHRAVRCRSRDAASLVVRQAPRAAAHTYWLADAGGVEDLETTATTWVRRVATTPLCRSNHCLVLDHARREAEAPSSSSRARLARMRAFLAGGGLTREALQKTFADRSDGVDSINRWPEDKQGTATDAVVIAEPASRVLWACKGPADRGAWVALRPGG